MAFRRKRRRFGKRSRPLKRRGKRVRPMRIGFRMS